MTLLPTHPPADPDGSEPARMVSVRRAGSGEPAAGGSSTVGGMDLRFAASSVIGGAKRSLLSTAKSLLVLAAVLAGAAAWWAGQTSGWRGFFAAVLVAFPNLFVALIAAARTAAGAMASETVRQSRLGSKVLDDLLSQLAREGTTSDVASDAMPASPLMSQQVAETRLREAVAETQARHRAGGVVALLNPAGQILPIVRRLLVPEFRRQAQGGHLNLDRVRQSLGPTVDDSVAEAMRADSRSVVMGAALSMTVWAAVVGFLLSL